jgi:hypothetical protein
MSDTAAMPDTEVSATAGAAALPRPRTAADDTAPDDAVARPAASYPWPEPWRSSRAARPRNEYWDVESAGWRSRGPVAGNPTAG